MIVIGHDPSVSPNLSLVCSERGWIGYADASETSVKVSKSKTRPSAGLVAEVIRSWVVLEGASVVVAEKIGPWSGQGLVSSAEFVGAMRLIEGVAAGAGLRYVDLTPPVWKREVGLLNKDKDASRALAVSLWPAKASWLARKLDHNRAEAALIAWAWMRKEGVAVWK